jgi:hypothetical protein
VYRIWKYKLDGETVPVAVVEHPGEAKDICVEASKGCYARVVLIGEGKPQFYFNALDGTPKKEDWKETVLGLIRNKHERKLRLQCQK